MATEQRTRHPTEGQELGRWTKTIVTNSGEEIRQQRRMVVDFDRGQASIRKEVATHGDRDWTVVEAWAVTPRDVEKTVDDYSEVDT